MHGCHIVRKRRLAILLVGAAFFWLTAAAATTQDLFSLRQNAPMPERSMPDLRRLPPSKKREEDYLNKPYSGSVNFPRDLSPLAKKIYDAVLKAARKRPKLSTVHVDDIATAGEVTEVAVSLTSGPKDKVCQDIYANTILRAKEEVLIQTYFYAPKKKHGSESSPETKPIRVILTVDSQSLIVYGSNLNKNAFYMSTTWNELPPSAYFDMSRLKGLDVRIFLFHNYPLGSIHSKNIIVDGQWSCIGSKNLDNEGTQELGIQMYGPVSRVMRRDFFRLLKGYKVPEVELRTPEPVKEMGMAPMIVVGKAAQRGIPGFNSFDSPQNVAWKTVFEKAEKKVFILTPNFNVPEFFKAAIDMVKRGKAFTLVVSRKMLNFGQHLSKAAGSKGTNHEVANQFYDYIDAHPEVAERVKVLYFSPKDEVVEDRNVTEEERMRKKKAENSSHVKLMIADGKLLIVGSGNMDQQSAYYSQEFNLVIDDGVVTENVRRALKEEMRKEDVSFKPTNVRKGN
ncbi:hypothetical protein SYNPS1DRAFT_30085 [Syncephalis pseudoplumigaleata]|uniref:PLD phosphodiesterase domain-containing protein n=1 Tax=Syncephalis pseudoplumigaleata TaxID=1712513 RepID=A0A4P9YW59_9FUNG|nr:hypothetical protein SYNPS1DRAFT_30085 [Syncephalis pseudoplumigaleata]|eukprot:RKP24144.1 hypothetical protein SYNPS1DRAFT_30085 [Syncephalis pseudoplumigaleata]